jgi:FkbM family methyltransferase
MVRSLRGWWSGKAMGLRSLGRIAPRLREPLRFCARQITRRRGLGRYHLRGSDVVICIRHSTPDVITMEEVLAERQYEPPAPVRPVLEPNGRVLQVADLGANVGLFSAWLLARRPDARIIAFEPDPANVAVLRECVRANHRDGTWEIVEACAANRDGELRFASGDFAVSRIATGEEPGSNVLTLPAVDVFPRIGEADLVKLDIEGGEWSILGDERFPGLRARALVLEYHPHLCPDPDPHAHVRALLDGAGWKIAAATAERPDGHGVIWAWK